jgi:hypothetical protein
MTLQIPLANYPGSGVKLPVTLDYSTNSLRRIGYTNLVHATVGGYPVPRAASEAIYAEWSTAGWTTSLDVPKIEWPKVGDRFPITQSFLLTSDRYGEYTPRPIGCPEENDVKKQKADLLQGTPPSTMTSY